VEAKFYAIGPNLQALFKEFNNVQTRYTIFDSAVSFEEAEQFIKGINEQIITVKPDLKCNTSIPQNSLHLNYSNQYSLIPLQVTQTNNQQVLYGGVEQELQMLMEYPEYAKLIEDIYIQTANKPNTYKVFSNNLTKLSLNNCNIYLSIDNDDVVKSIVEIQNKQTMLSLSADNKHLNKLLSSIKSFTAINIDNIFNEKNTLKVLVLNYPEHISKSLKAAILYVANNKSTNLTGEDYSNFYSLLKKMATHFKLLSINDIPPHKQFISNLKSIIANSKNQIKHLTLRNIGLDLDDYKLLLEFIASSGCKLKALEISLKIYMGNAYFVNPTTQESIFNQPNAIHQYRDFLFKTLNESKLKIENFIVSFTAIDRIGHNINIFETHRDVAELINIISKKQPSIKTLNVSFNSSLIAFSKSYIDKIVEATNNLKFKLISLDINDGTNLESFHNIYNFKLSPLNQIIFNKIKNNKSLSYYNGQPMPKYWFLKETAEFIYNKGYNSQADYDNDLMFYTHLRRYIKFKTSIQEIIFNEYGEFVEKDLKNILKDNYLYIEQIITPKNDPRNETNWQEAHKNNDEKWAEVLENNSQAPLLMLPNEIMVGIFTYLLHDYKPVEFAGEVNIIDEASC
jgi:hypothetical protein